MKVTIGTQEAVSWPAAMEETSVNLVRSLVAEGVFGDVVLVDLEPEDQNIGIQFASQLVFLKLTVRGNEGLEELHLMVKVLPVEFASIVKFKNELLMYKEVMPALGADEKIRLFYGQVSEEESDRNALVFDNVQCKGYRNCEQRPFIDFEHISLAMKEIAKFHSLSYIHKHDNKEHFNVMAGKLKEVEAGDEDFNKYNTAWSQRGIKAFLKSEVMDTFWKDLSNTFERPELLLKALSAPEEPFAVMCHGDFCNCNVMHKYDQDGSPTDCVLFDFQTSKYGSPAFDLAFYLYMHTTADIREKHWDHFLKIYWQTVIDNVPKRISMPSFEEFLDHFAPRAVYGYLISCFYVPVVQDPSIKFWDRSKTLEDRINICWTAGGKEHDQILSDMVSHMYHKNYLNAFLDFVKKENLL